MKRKLQLVLLAVLWLATACGGGDSRGDAWCADELKALNEIDAGSQTTPLTEDEFAAYMERFEEWNKRCG